jgi:uncharacterized protein YqgV (UPF0045/DUF77 family)
VSKRCTAEFLVEPFEVGHPGRHVQAAFAAVRELGFDPEIGPFGTTIAGDCTLVMEAVQQLVEAASAAGATRVTIQVEVDDG